MILDAKQLVVKVQTRFICEIINGFVVIALAQAFYLQHLALLRPKTLVLTDIHEAVPKKGLLA